MSGRTRDHCGEIRRATLTGLLPRRRRASAFPSTSTATAKPIFEHACRLGAEGIVAKRRDRPYHSGRRADWVKIKNPDAPAAKRVIER
jgi:bifunctional non-homologous end joining protein LigD